MASVFLVDSALGVRTRVRALLSAMMGLAVAGEAGDPDAAVSGIVRTDPDVVVLDLLLAGGGSGMDVLRRLKGRVRSRFIVYSNYTEPEAVRECRQAGAHVVIDKATGIDRLVEAIRIMTEGGQ